MSERIESSPVRQSLLAEMTTFGVDDWLFVINIEVALIMGMALRIWQWFVLAFLLHFMLMIVTRLSPNIVMVYVKYARQAGRYTASWLPVQRRCLRPAQLGRELEQ